MKNDLIAIIACAVAFTLGACASALSDADKRSIDISMRLSTAAYARDDAGVQGELQRANYCAIAGLARRQNLPVVDAGIACQ